MHPWPLDRFAATHPREEPHALTSARADLCGGRSAMIVPTATSVSEVAERIGDLALGEIRAAEKRVYQRCADLSNTRGPAHTP
jgi:hypothetical protein